MGQIDVSDLITDPDFVDPIMIIHRQSIVDQYGNNRLDEQGEPSFGSVQPASGKTLQRIPEAFRVASVMSFWVKGKIISDGRCQYPDIIIYKGSRYAVQVIFDWTNWGEGFSEGTCVRQVPAL
jgi:hypothetical protein